jgi:hypothetical protein
MPRRRRPQEPGDHGRIPEDCARVPGSSGRIPGNRGRIPRSRGRIPRSRGRIPGDRGQGTAPSRLGLHGTGWLPDAREPGTGGPQGPRRAPTGGGGGAPRPGCRLVHEPGAPKSHPRTGVQSWQAFAARPRRVATASVARSWRFSRLSPHASVAARLRGSFGCPVRRWRQREAGGSRRRPPGPSCSFLRLSAGSWSGGRLRPRMGARFAGPLGPIASASSGALHRSPAGATCAGSRRRRALRSAPARDPEGTSGWSDAGHRRWGSGGHVAGLRRRTSGGHAAGLRRWGSGAHAADLRCLTSAGHACLRRSCWRGLPRRDRCAVAARRNRTRADPGLGSWIRWSRPTSDSPTSDSSPGSPHLSQR